MLIAVRWVGGRYYSVDDLVNTSYLGLVSSTVLLQLATFSLWKNRQKRSMSVIHMTNKPEPSTIWEKMDAWVNVKGEVSSLVGHVFRWLLTAGAGATLLYLYQHLNEWF